MDRPKSKKSSSSQPHASDTTDSLVSALTNEIVAPENLKLVVPVTLFAVRPKYQIRELRVVGSCFLFE